MKDTSNSNALSAEDEAKLKKYRKMQKMRMPQQSIINRMIQDKIDRALIGKLFPDAMEGKVASKGGGGGKGSLLKSLKKKKPELPPNLKPKKVIKPNAKMKQLHWICVNPFDVKLTIWSTINDSKIKFDARDLESKFCWKQQTSNSQSNNEQKVEQKRSKKKEVVRVLDTRRSYNVEIFLGRLKMDPWVIREAILSFNEEKLNLDKIQKLTNFVPTAAECQLLDGYEKETNLAVAETFFKILKSVDANLKQRLELWTFKLDFRHLIHDAHGKLMELQLGYECIKKSKHLAEVFTIILAIGNYMNGSTKKGQSYGFKLASLVQLNRSRTVDNSQTLMEYLYLFMVGNQDTADEDCKEENVNNIKPSQYSHCLEFVEDLLPLTDAIHVDVSILRSNIGQIGAKLRLIGNRIKNEKQSGGPRIGDAFVSVMQPFHRQAVKQHEKLVKFQDKVCELLKELGVWLNEGKDKNFQYLQTLHDFRSNFIHAKKTVVEKIEIKRRMARKKKAREEAEELKKQRKKRRKRIKKQKIVIELFKDEDIANNDEKEPSSNTNTNKKDNLQNSNKNTNKEKMEIAVDEEDDESSEVSPPVDQFQPRDRLNSRAVNVTDLVISQVVADNTSNFIRKLQSRNKRFANFLLFRK